MQIGIMSQVSVALGNNTTNGIVIRVTLQSSAALNAYERRFSLWDSSEIRVILSGFLAHFAL